MNAHIFTGTEITAGRRRPSEIVAEYDAKREALADALAEFEAAGKDMERAASVGGAYGGVTIDTGRIWSNTLERALLGSAGARSRVSRRGIRSRRARC